MLWITVAATATLSLNKCCEIAVSCHRPNETLFVTLVPILQGPITFIASKSCSGPKRRSYISTTAGVIMEFSAHHGTASWFAVSTRSRQEKIAATMLGHIAITSFLPILKQE